MNHSTTKPANTAPQQCEITAGTALFMSSRSERLNRRDYLPEDRLRLPGRIYLAKQTDRPIVLSQRFSFLVINFKPTPHDCRIIVRPLNQHRLAYIANPRLQRRLIY